MRSSIWCWSTAAFTQFAVTSLMSRFSTSSRIARSAARDSPRWDRSRERGSWASWGSADGVDTGAASGDLLRK